MNIEEGATGDTSKQECSRSDIAKAMHHPATDSMLPIACQAYQLDSKRFMKIVVRNDFNKSFARLRTDSSIPIRISPFLLIIGRDD